jgi:hypothetical protein
MNDSDVQVLLVNARNIPREHLVSTDERLLGNSTRTLTNFNSLNSRRPTMYDRAYRILRDDRSIMRTGTLSIVEY